MTNNIVCVTHADVCQWLQVFSHIPNSTIKCLILNFLKRLRCLQWTLLEVVAMEKKCGHEIKQLSSAQYMHAHAIQLFKVDAQGAFL